MKGISPVIATVLLLLMAVASVGGAWIWYQRQSSIVSSKSEERINEQIETQQAAAVTLNDIYLSGGKVVLIVSNAGSNSVNITGYKVAVGSTTTVNTTYTKTLGAKATDTITTTVSCPSGSTAKIQLFVSGTSTQIYTETC